MFYNARWYDPGLGRFAQADTMLDNPITGWDRYSYVQNNPVRYTDPTGHLTDKERCPDGVCENLGKQSNPKTWDEVDTNLLLSDTAKDLYKLYIEMWKQKDGWWWEKYGEDGFTIWEFMAMFWAYEQADYHPGQNISDAMANHSADWCASQGCIHNDAEGALSFLAAYSASAKKRADLVITKGTKTTYDVFYKPPSYFSDGMHVVTAIRNRVGVDYDKVERSDLYDFGNISLSNKVLSMMIKRDMVYSYWGDGNTFIVLTKCQSAFYSAARREGVGFITKKNYKMYCGG